MGVKISVMSRGWTRLQVWTFWGAFVCMGLLWAWPLPSGAQSGPLFSTKAVTSVTPGNHSVLLSAGRHVVSTEQVRAELLVHAPQGIQAGQTFWLGLQIEHQPDWHTYWQNPGDSGLPTRLQWRLPAGLQAGDIAWPLPKKFPIGTLANYGYEGRLLLAVPITVSADFKFPANAPLAIQLQADWLVCRKECIPQEGQFVLGLASAAPQSPHAAGFEKARVQSPQKMALPPAHNPTASGAQTTLSADGKRLNLQISGLPDNWRGQTLSAFPVTPNVVHNAAVQGNDWTQNWQGAVWNADIPVSEERGDSPRSMRWVLAVGPESSPKAPAVELETPVAGTWPALTQAAPAEISPALAKALAENARLAEKPATSSTTALGLTLAILGALAGGLLLNLMPCVFPILAIKVLGFAQADT
jgi:thiol:disulfide interchange protein DsbD